MSEKIRIGLETHVQLNTRSKMFCGCSTSPTERPNVNVCDVCLGFPGTKPRLNRAVIEKGIKVALALNCKLPSKIFFSRKSYFYPDMSKNFQITQYEIPIGESGFIEISSKKIRIRRINLEEDPAKLVHPGGDITKAKYSLIDYNRSGIPLCEIVTDPDFENIDEIKEYFTKLISILQHLEVFDPSRGTIKTDVNISIGDGERIEIKNISGVKAIEKAILFEITRQKRLRKAGKKIKMETRHFNPKTGLTYSLREKETEEDYGYIFEPDLSWIYLSKELIDKIKNELPELPDARILRFEREYKIPKIIAKTIVYTDKFLADFFEEVCSKFNDYLLASKWISGDLLKCLNWNSIRISQSNVTVDDFVNFLKMMKNKEITPRMGKEIIMEWVEKKTSLNEIMKGRELGVIESEGDLRKIVEDVIKRNEKAVLDYKSGNEKAFHFIVGEVMKETKGRAEVKIVKKIVSELLK